MSDVFDMRAARLNLGLTQREVAKAAKVALVTVQNLENRSGRAHPRNAKRLADFFGVDVLDLMPPTPDREAA